MTVTLKSLCRYVYCIISGYIYNYITLYNVQCMPDVLVYESIYIMCDLSIYIVCGLQVLYVLYFDRDSETEMLKASSVTEFLLAHPCLSLAVFDSVASPVHSRLPDTSLPGLSSLVDGSSNHGWYLSVL